MDFRGFDSVSEGSLSHADPVISGDRLISHQCYADDLYGCSLQMNSQSALQSSFHSLTLKLLVDSLLAPFYLLNVYRLIVVFHWCLSWPGSRRGWHICIFHIAFIYFCICCPQSTHGNSYLGFHSYSVIHASSCVQLFIHTTHSLALPFSLSFPHVVPESLMAPRHTWTSVSGDVLFLASNFLCNLFYHILS